jgi:hypothetical protein
MVASAVRTAKDAGASDTITARQDANVKAAIVRHARTPALRLPAHWPWHREWQTMSPTPTPHQHPASIHTGQHQAVGAGHTHNPRPASLLVDVWRRRAWLRAGCRAAGVVSLGPSSSMSRWCGRPGSGYGHAARKHEPAIGKVYAWYTGEALPGTGPAWFCKRLIQGCNDPKALGNGRSTITERRRTIKLHRQTRKRLQHAETPQRLPEIAQATSRLRVGATT